MWQELLTRLATVRTATTAEEREAIYRFRYTIYVEELDKGFMDVDHDRRWVHDEGDELAGTSLFYTGSPERVTGTLRLEVWRAPDAPALVRSRFCLDRFPDWTSLRVSEVSRLLIAPGLRGGVVLPALARAGYEAMYAAGVDLVFCYCAPGLVRRYAALGFRPYGADLVRNEDGIRVPLVGVPSDLEFLRRSKSPVLPLVRRTYGKDKRLDLSSMTELLAPETQTVEVDPERVWAKLQDALAEQQVDERQARAEARRLLFRDIRADEERWMLRTGFIMEAPRDSLLIRQGLVEREMFYILAGHFAVERDGKLVALRGPGDVVGEMALFSEGGRRTAAVRSLEPGRVLVLRRRLLDELMKQRPELAARLLFNISAVLSERLQEATGKLVGGE